MAVKKAPLRPPGLRGAFHLYTTAAAERAASSGSSVCPRCRRQGMTAAGADAKLLTVDQVNTAELNGYAAIAFG